MEMTRDEIVRKYNDAEKKKGYIQILADLNGCEKKDIVEILRDAGVPLPGNPNMVKPADQSEMKLIIPEEVRSQLMEDLEHIDLQIIELTKRRRAIWEFVK